MQIGGILFPQSRNFLKTKRLSCMASMSNIINSTLTGSTIDYKTSIFEHRFYAYRQKIMRLTEIKIELNLCCGVTLTV